MKRVRKTYFIAALLTACAVLSACHAPPQMITCDNVRGHYVPYTIAVAPVEIALDDTQFDKGVFGREKVDFDAVELRKEILRQVRTSGLFKRAGLDGETSGKDAQLLLKVKITRSALRFEYFDGWDTAFYLWLLAWVPSWYTADEVYSVHFNAEVEVQSLVSEKLLYRRKFDFTYRQALDDFERGWMLYGLFRVPDELTDANWDMVEKSVKPYAANRLAVQVAEILCERFFKKTKHPAFKKVLGVK